MRKVFQVGLLLTLAGLCAPSARATMWMPPIRPLTADEKMEMAVAYAHAVGFGSVLSIQDSIAPDGMAWRWMVFQPERWLKGDAPVAQLRIYFPQISNFGYRQVREWKRSQPARSLVFVRWVADPNAPYWVLAEHPDFPGAGILRMPDGDTAAHEAAAAQAVKRVTPEELARRSALVVVGTVRATRSRLRVHGNEIKCTEVVVDSVVVGRPPPGPFCVYGPYGGLGMTGPMLLMLKPGEGGAYEIVGTTAGAMVIKGGAVEQLGESLPPLVSRIRHAISARRSGP